MSRLDQLLNYANSPRIAPRGLEAKTPWVSTDNYMSSSTLFFIHFDTFANTLTQDQILAIVMSLVIWGRE